ncbi:MAG: hypothetical protein C0475_03115 [Planctomyces sp.]|nr:hypothetical protein [Planctomyces sp.]
MDDVFGRGSHGPSGLDESRWAIETALSLASQPYRRVTQWLSPMAAAVREGLGRFVVGASGSPVQVIGVWVALVRPGHSGWDHVDYALDGYAHDAVRMFVEKLLDDRCLDDDLPAGIGPRSGLVWDGCRARHRVLDDQSWALSRYHQSRAPLELGEFVRLCMNVPAMGPGLALIVQADMGACSRDDAERVEAFIARSRGLIEGAFLRCVAGPEQRRNWLRQRVSVTQRAILELLVEGLTERQIGRKVHRSPHTIHDHIKGIYAALGVSSRLELVRLWDGTWAPSAPGPEELAIGVPTQNGPGHLSAIGGLAPEQATRQGALPREN